MKSALQEDGVSLFIVHLASRFLGKYEVVRGNHHSEPLLRCIKSSFYEAFPVDYLLLQSLSRLVAMSVIAVIA